MQSIRSFKAYLEKLGIEIVESAIDEEEVNRISLEYSLEVPDALHVAMARKKATYLITIDPDFSEARIKEPQIMKPATLVSHPAFRSKKH